MAVLRRGGPYIWITWLTKLLAGEVNCEWASWFKSQHEGNSWERSSSGFDLVRWQVGHTDMLRRCAQEHRQQGYTVTMEGQNSFTLQGKTATLAGKPDLVVHRDNLVTVIDIKTGRPRASDQVQVMLYMHLLALVRPEFQGCAVTGQVVYSNHVVDIPNEAVDDSFVTSARDLISRVAARESASKVPSWSECRYCEITSADCPDRMEAPAADAARTDFF
ncbi:MAG: PD-(D/E)XK nuclease family protein [Chloroflexi bacterium]|nr:PD-(D/E)XK nuclease family protein [Chloroflexota bacterium]